MTFTPQIVDGEAVLVVVSGQEWRETCAQVLSSRVRLVHRSRQWRLHSPPCAEAARLELRLIMKLMSVCKQVL